MHTPALIALVALVMVAGVLSVVAADFNQRGDTFASLHGMHAFWP
jgi:Flp pilus assembly protein CpaB